MNPYQSHLRGWLFIFIKEFEQYGFWNFRFNFSFKIPLKFLMNACCIIFYDKI